MINTLALKNFYEANKQSYIDARKSDDLSRWDESYKWDILPTLNNELKHFDGITEENALHIVKLLQKMNPQSGTFCHWIDLDNLSAQLVKKPVASKALAYVWHPSPETIGAEINNINNLLHTFFSGEFKLSPSTYGYILAAQSCEDFAIYREALLTDLVEINVAAKPQNQGEKYQLLNDSARYIGSLMAEEPAIYNDREFFGALNGQDFLYVTIQYPKEV